jgi:hypothetical protein
MFLVSKKLLEKYSRSSWARQAPLYEQSAALLREIFIDGEITRHTPGYQYPPTIIGWRSLIRAR